MITWTIEVLLNHTTHGTGMHTQSRNAHTHTDIPTHTHTHRERERERETYLFKRMVFDSSGRALKSFDMRRGYKIITMREREREKEKTHSSEYGPQSHLCHLLIQAKSEVANNELHMKEYLLSVCASL